MTITPHDAFITYTQGGELDRALARAVQHALHRLARPFYRLRAMNVFRDETSLAQTNALTGAIAQHLAGSEFLLVIASPASAKAEWVRLETREWLRLGRLGNLVIIVADGVFKWDAAAARFDATTDCLTPELLAADWQDQPLMIDIRSIKQSDLVLRNPEFSLAMARIAARIRRTEPYLLISQDVSEHRKKLVVAWSAVTMIVASASVAGLLFVSERASRRSAELRLADSLVFQSREDVSRRQWTQALSSVERARGTYLALGRSTLLADFGEWMVRRAARFPFRTRRYDAKLFSAVAFDCGRQAVVAGDQSGEMVSWDLRTGQVAALPARHDARVTAIRIAGTRMFSAGYDGRVLHWDLATVPPTASSVPLPFNKAISAFDISNEAGALYLGLTDGSIAAFQLNKRHSVSWPAHSGVITGLRASADGQRLVSVSKDNRLRIWQLASGGWRQTRDIRQAGPIQAVDILQELGWLFTANANGSVATIDFATGSEVRAPNAPLEGAMSLAISTSGEYGATADFSGTVQVWDVATGAPVAELVGHRKAVLASGFSCDGRYLATGGNDGLLALWSMTPPELQAGVRLARNSQALLTPDGLYMLIGGTDGSVRIVDAISSLPIRNQRIVDRPISAMALSPDGVTVVIGTDTGDLLLIDRSRDKLTLRATLRSVPHAVRRLAVANGGRLVAALDSHDGLSLHAVGRIALHRRFEGATTLALGATGDHLVIGTSNGAVRRLDTRRLSEEREIARHDRPVTALAFAPDREHVLSGDAAGGVTISPIEPSKRHGGPVRLSSPDNLSDADQFGGLLALAAVDDGRVVIGMTDRFRVGVWELEFHRNLFSRAETMYPGFNTGIQSSTIATDGRALLALSAEGVPLLLRLTLSGAKPAGASP